MEEPLYLMPEDVLYEVTVETDSSMDHQNSFDTLSGLIHVTLDHGYAATDTLCQVSVSNVRSLSESSSFDTEDMDVTSSMARTGISAAVVENDAFESPSYTVDITSKLDRINTTRLDTVSSPISDHGYAVQADVIRSEMSVDDIISLSSFSDTEDTDTALESAYPNASMNGLADAPSDNSVEDTTLDTAIVLSDSDESSSESSSSDTEDENIASVNVNGPCKVPSHISQTSMTKPSVIFQKLVSLPLSQSNMGGTLKTAKPYACMVLNNCKSVIPSHIRVGQTIFKRAMPESSEIFRKCFPLASSSHTAVDRSSTTALSNASMIASSQKSLIFSCNGTVKSSSLVAESNQPLIPSQPLVHTTVSNSSRTTIPNKSTICSNQKSVIPACNATGKNTFYAPTVPSQSLSRTTVNNSSTIALSNASTIVNSQKSLTPACNGTAKSASSVAAPSQPMIHSEPSPCTTVSNTIRTAIPIKSKVVNRRKSLTSAHNGTQKNVLHAAAPKPPLIQSKPRSRSLVSTASQTDLSNSSRTENATDNSAKNGEVEKNSSVTRTHVTNTKDLRSMNVIEFCQKVGLMAKRFKCDCGAWMRLIRKAYAKVGYIWRCQKTLSRNKNHDKKISVTSGTFFYLAKIEIKISLEVMYMWLHRCPAKYILVETGISRDTMRDLINKCKNICVAHLETNSAPIGGGDKVVEISEALFEIDSGRKKSSKSYGKDRGLWVFGGIEEGTTQCFFVTMPNEKSRTLSKAMKRYILPNTTVSTTYFKAFKCLEDDDFDNLTQLHGLKFKDKTRGTFMITIEMLWEFSKKKVSRGEHFSKKVSLAQHLYRKSTNNVPDPFLKFLTDAAAVHPPITDLCQRGGIS